MLKILWASLHVFAIIGLAIFAALKEYHELREEGFGFGAHKWSLFMMAPGAFIIASLGEMLEGWHVSAVWLIPLGLLYLVVLALAPKIFDRYFPHKPGE